MVKERNQQGRFTPEHTAEEILGAVRAHEPAATSEVAGELELSRQAVDYRLRRLRDEGRVNSKKIGASLVWFAPESGTESTPERRETPPPEPRDRTDTAPEVPERDDTHAEDADAGGEPETVPDVVERVAEEWEDTDERLEARKAAARAVLDYAHEHGGVSKQEAKEEVFPEYPVEGQNARTWYRKNIRPVLNEAAEYDQSARAYQLVDDVEA